MTKYVVLRKVEHLPDVDYDDWIVWDSNVEARSADEAIEQTVPSARSDLNEKEVWVAVPERHWQPAPVYAEETLSVRVVRVDAAATTP